PLAKKIDFISVFDKIPLSTGPKVPGMPEMKLPEFKAGQEYLVPPDKQKNVAGVLRFSPMEAIAHELPTPKNAAFHRRLTMLRTNAAFFAIAHELPTPKNAAFVRNIVNRLWFVMFGRGIVNPLDQHHQANPPSHQEVLDLLSQDFAAHK